MILVKNIELIKEEKELNFLLKGIEKVREMTKTKELVLQTQKPYDVKREILDQVNAWIFFDFPSLKQVKLMMANEIIKIESQFRSMEFETQVDKDKDDDED